MEYGVICVLIPVYYIVQNLQDFYSAALAAMTEKGVIEYFDAYTCHAYMGHYKAEDTYKDSIT